jgi:hypothetical protein
MLPRMQRNWVSHTYLASGNLQWYRPQENSLAMTSTTKHIQIPANTLLDTCLYLNKNLYTIGHSSFIYNSQVPEQSNVLQ